MSFGKSFLSWSDIKDPGLWNRISTICRVTLIGYYFLVSFYESQSYLQSYLQMGIHWILLLTGGSLVVDSLTASSYLSEKKKSKLLNSLLLESLTSDDSHARLSAISALAEIGDEQAVPTLCNILATDQNPDVRRSAAEALGMIGNKEPRAKS